MKELVLLILALVPRTALADAWAFAGAIDEATDRREERDALTVIAHAENWFHLASATPYFGVTLYAATHPGEVITVARGAVIALAHIRFIRRVRCPGAALGAVLGRYHHGNGTGVRGGCYVDTLAAVQMRWWHDLAVARERLGYP